MRFFGGAPFRAESADHPRSAHLADLTRHPSPFRCRRAPLHSNPSNAWSSVSRLSHGINTATRRCGATSALSRAVTRWRSTREEPGSAKPRRHQVFYEAVRALKLPRSSQRAAQGIMGGLPAEFDVSKDGVLQRQGLKCQNTAHPHGPDQ